MAPRRERGQASAEKTGLIVLLLAIFGVLFTSGLRTQAANATEEAVCVIFNLGDDCGGSSEDGTWEEGEPTPLELALAGDYVAIGDSYSSGEGAGDYEEGTDCRRSANAYPEQVAGQFDFEGVARNVTCSGARVANAQTDGQHDEPAQVEAITEDTSLVTIGIGGNDTDWTSVVQACLVPAFFDGCEDTDAVRQAMEDAAEDIGDLYQDARDRAPDDARVVAVGYPRFFPADPDETYSYCIGLDTWLGCAPIPGVPGTGTTLNIDEDTQRWMNDMFREFNDVLEREAEAAGIEFVDMYDAFEGCELTTSDACMHGLKLTMDWPPIHSDSFHPNADGHDRMTDLVADQIEDP